MQSVISVLFLLILAPAAAAEPSPMETSFVGNPLVIINITYDPRPGGGDGFEGEIVLELFLNWAPISVSNFLGLVNQSFYDGIFYHRIIDDFVIQSGDPTCRATVVYTPVPTCGEGGSGETIPFESNANLTHVNGAIGMARGADPDSAESQWYICDEPQHQLDNGNRTLPDDPGYAVFGVVREGLELVRAAAAVPTTNDPGGEDTPRVGTGVGDRPLYEVHINSVTLSGWVPGPAAPTPAPERAPAALLLTGMLAVAGALGAMWWLRRPAGD
ncbi:MAG: peptidylprolyl isomerase [Candidatus Poseidoniia archaeon]|jgi:peptidyl-prolyl cis-trans isomerase B (cyclophilin B)|nr:peptidylprolyl isomerase [Candidatus Poseidoniia archaeon]